MQKMAAVTTITEEIKKRCLALIQQADQVMIGIGQGLSLAAGAPLGDQSLAAAFPQLSQEGLSTYAEAEAALSPEDSRYWGYWFRRIKQLRFDFPRSMVYDQLLDLVAEKDYFIITSTDDGLLYKSKVTKERVYTPQGDLARLQCAVDCAGQTISVLPYLKKALPHIDEATLHLPAEYAPRCPHCGGPMVVNSWRDNHFCHRPYAQAAAQMNHFLTREPEGFLLLLEIGVGYSQPNLIRFPFEHLAESRRQAALLRINTDHPLCAAENRQRAICIGMDAKAALYVLTS